MKVHTLSADATITMTAAALVFAVILSPAAAFASDQSDAVSLREKCEAEARPLEISVTNFGGDSERDGFQKGLGMLKSAKVMMAQSRYVEAKAVYADYLKKQSEVYKGLASLYVARAGTVINEITAELVDYIDNRKVDQYFKLAAQNINDAKSSIVGEHYKNAVEQCRMAKKYVIETYGLVQKTLPQKYTKDLKDIGKEIYRGAP